MKRSIKCMLATIGLTAALGLLPSAPGFAAETSGFELTVLVGDTPRPEYAARGALYVEAVRGRNYSLRITNPTPYRVAVALSVDGLNTIDARHTDAKNAAKWLLDPYESTVISGWQVSGSDARRFFFTGEKHSYGASLGETDNLGVITAVFYRELRPRNTYYAPQGDERRNAAPGESPAQPRMEADGAVGSAGAAPPPAKAHAPKPVDDYAATGIGERTRHEVTTVDVDLEPQPAATMRIRYEFHPQLVKLGVLPSRPTPLERRERARGFAAYCPEPD
ncbi:MAG: hypothetical protein JWN02_400 [Acidobacteria bacterium]|nr:hypothetical protein [Acidobacteriota bacterium]